MRAIDETIEALGPPVLFRALGAPSTASAAIARWRHGAGVVDVAPSDSIRLAMSLVDRPNAQDRNGGLPVEPIRGASITVFSPVEGASVEVRGEADVVQLFLDQASAQAMLDTPFICPPMLDLRDDWIRTMIMRALVNSVRPRPDDGLMMEEALHALVLRLEGHASRWRKRSETASTLFRGGLAPAAFRRVEAMIETALDEGASPSLAEMAMAVGLSVTYFARAFRRHTGSTPHNHVVRRRMDRAVSLLRGPDVPVAEVAETIGFATPAHFVATFRSAMGVTPGALRTALAG